MSLYNSIISTFSSALSYGPKTKVSGTKPGQDTVPQIPAKPMTPGNGLSLLDDTQGPHPTQATIDTWRSMRRNPTVALARMVGSAPIKATPWAFTARDGTPDDVVSFVEGAIKPLAFELINDMCLAMDYGFQAFERQWEYKDGRMVYARLKPLLPDVTEALVIRETGKLAGWRNVNVDLLGLKSFGYTYDREYDNYYGRSRHENYRVTAYEGWLYAFSKLKRYTAKAAGTTPLVKYPVGQSQDPSGSIRDNQTLADYLLSGLGQGHGVAMPKMDFKAMAEVARQAGVDPSQWAAWEVSFIEPSGLHGDELINQLRYWDALICRGWLVPERAATEATQAGSRADSGTAADMAMSASGETLASMIRCINQQVVNPLLVVNFGPQYKDAVTVEAVPIDSGQQDRIYNLMSQVLANPANVDLLIDAVDLDAALDKAQIPKKKSFVDPSVRAVQPAQETQDEQGAQFSESARTMMAAMLDGYKGK